MQNQILKQRLQQKEEDLFFLKEELNNTLDELDRLKIENENLQSKHRKLGKDCDEYVEKMYDQVTTLRKRVRDLVHDSKNSRKGASKSKKQKKDLERL